MDNEHGNKILYLEPFYGGSHKQLMALLQREFSGDIYSLPDTKWHWRMRVSALHFMQEIPYHQPYKVLFASSVLNLCELVALRPDLNNHVMKILYFHENQLVYPVRNHKERDFQFGYNQILSCLVVDHVVFNSQYNMDSFLGNIDTFMGLLPDYRPHGLPEAIRPKCRVLYYPIEVPISFKYSELQESVVHVGEGVSDSASSVYCERHDPLHIVWPHRWEHDKCPELLCSMVCRLYEEGLKFRLSILGSHTNDIPDCLQKISSQLSDDLVHFGGVSRNVYWEVLSKADVVLSTAKHEFYGVAMLEATYCGCYPLCPNALVYPEIYPAQCLYNTEQQLYKKLKNLCTKPYLAKHYRNNMHIDFHQYTWEALQEKYRSLITTE